MYEGARGPGAAASASTPRRRSARRPAPASRPARSPATRRSSTRAASSSCSRKHYSRYTPEMVERVCGIPRETFLEIAETLIANSGRERTTVLVYGVSWTQHSLGVQMIRAGAIVQLLLGNIGRPGGGIMAMRGHASIQGSSDIPTLYDLLPGYLPMPQGLRGGPHARELHRGGRLRARLVEQLRQVHRRAAEGLVRAQRDGGERLRLRPPAEDLRQPLALPDDAARPRRRRRRDVRDGPEPRRRLTALGAAAARARRAEVARRARPRRGRVGALLARLAGGRVGRARHGGDPDGGLPDARRRPHREGGPLHQHPAPPAVARQGARPAGRRALGAAFHAPPRQARAGALRGLRGPEGLAAAQPALGLRGARAAPRAVRRGRAEGDRRLRDRERAAAERLHGDRGRRQDRLRVLDLRRLLRRRRQPAAPARPRGPRRPRGRLGLARVGLGVAGQPAPALQPRVGRSAGQAVVGAQEVRLVGRGAGQVDGLRRPGLPGRQAPRLRGARRRRGHGRRSRATTRSS